VSDKTVYRSTHPDVLKVWDDAHKRAEEIDKARRALLDELGFEGRPGLIDDVGIYGVQHLDEHGPVPDGWLRDRRTEGAIVPDRRRKLGREVAGKFKGLTMPDLRRLLPGGMPSTVLHLEISKRFWPAIKRFDDAVYVVWGCDPEQLERADRINSEVWERVKLSEYYAAVEVHEAAQAEQDGGQADG
jgi:hypothetical protein